VEGVVAVQSGFLLAVFVYAEARAARRLVVIRHALTDHVSSPNTCQKIIQVTGLSIIRVLSVISELITIFNWLFEDLTIVGIRPPSHSFTHLKVVGEVFMR
jgi:hypothetical protein